MKRIATFAAGTGLIALGITVNSPQLREASLASAVVAGITGAFSRATMLRGVSSIIVDAVCVLLTAISAAIALGAAGKNSHFTQPTAVIAAILIALGMLLWIDSFSERPIGTGNSTGSPGTPDSAK